MIARDHNHTRRAVLGVAVAVPVLICASGSAGAQPDDGAWRRALAAFRRAEAAMNAAAGDPDEDRFDRRLGAFYAGLRRLLRIPAPDLAALSMKIDLTVDHDVATLTGGQLCLATLKQDARRLAAQE